MMIYMFISVMLKIVFEDEQYENEQIKLELRINEIFFGLCTIHTFQFTWHISIVMALSVANNFEIVLLLLLVQ